MCCSWDYTVCWVCAYIEHVIVCVLCGCVKALMYWGFKCADVQHAAAFCQADVSDVVVHMVINVGFFVTWSKNKGYRKK